MDLVVRPARPGDRAAIARISARIWGGHDYVPQFLSRWVKDGNFWLGEAAGRVIGFGKATEFAPGEWWLEGLRLDPDSRGRGLGRDLSLLILERTLRLKPKSVRLSTASMNRASLHIIREMGFRLLSTHHLHSSRPRKPGGPVRLVVPEPGEALDFIQASSEYRAAKGLLPYTWLFRAINRAYVRELCQGRFLRGFRAGERLSGVMVLRPHRYVHRDIDVSFVDGVPEALESFEQYLRYRAAAMGSNRISAMPAGRRMARILAQWGVKRTPGRWRVLVFELPPAGQRAGLGTMNIQTSDQSV